MRFTTKHLFAATLAVAAILMIGIAIKTAIEPRFVVVVDHPNGSRLRVTQTFTDDLFNTSIYFDDGDGQWRWYYFDHDDWYWRSAQTEVDGSLVQIRSGRRAIDFDVETGECHIVSAEVAGRTTGKSNRIRMLPKKLAGLLTSTHWK